MRRALLSSLVVLLACSGGEDPVSSASSTGTSTGGTTAMSTGGTAPTSTGAATSTGAPTSTGGGSSTTGSEGVAGLELMQRLAGLWSGPASMTPLGNFPLMNMDFRAVSDGVLFGRVDFDANNNLRFAFEIEDHGEGPVLVYRNGGYFLGLLRDSRTLLVEHKDNEWRFCHATNGCEYIDARFMFDGDDHVVLDVDVKGSQHVYWDALREETRPLPEPFPGDEMPQAPDAPFPTMPDLRVTVTWTEPLPQDGMVWVIVTTQPCDMQLNCKHSRSLMAAASAGATSASLLLTQIHPGDYRLTAILDRNGNLPDTLFPDTGDGVSLPNKPITVGPEGETAVQTAIYIDL